MKYDKKIDNEMGVRILFLYEKKYTFNEIADTLRLNVLEVIDYLRGYETELENK